MMIKGSLVFFLSSLFLFAGIPGNKPSFLDKETLSKISNGETVVYEIKDPDNVEGIRVIFSAHAKKEQIWSVITDYNNFINIFGNLNLKLVREDEKGAEVNASLDFLFLHYRYVLYHKYIKKFEKLEWMRTSGDLKIVSGSWTILPSENKETQIIVYESFIDTGDFFNTFAHIGITGRGEETAMKLREYLKKKFS